MSNEMDKLTRDMKHRINRRAYELSQDYYALIRAKMLADTRVINGVVAPESWIPDDLKKQGEV